MQETNNVNATKVIYIAKIKTSIQLFTITDIPGGISI